MWTHCTFLSVWPEAATHQAAAGKRLSPSANPHFSSAFSPAHPFRQPPSSDPANSRLITYPYSWNAPPHRRGCHYRYVS